MNAPRYVREYANDMKRTINALETIPERKVVFIQRVDGSVRACERGLITADEAVGLIHNALSEDIDEY